jgi:hypothetical protein
MNVQLCVPVVYAAKNRKLLNSKDVVSRERESRAASSLRVFGSNLLGPPSTPATTFSFILVVVSFSFFRNEVVEFCVLHSEGLLLSSAHVEFFFLLFGGRRHIVRARAERGYSSWWTLIQNYNCLLRSMPET